MVHTLRQKLLNNVRVTAEIVYRMPDYPLLLQTFIWQHDDIVPELQKLRKFLKFWDETLDGPIHQVLYTYQGLVSPAEIRFAEGNFFLQ